MGWVFLKIGFLFFGGGFLLIPLLHRQVVQDLHWLSPREFVDGVAISQLTPGPVAVLATFCGFHQGGVVGGIVSTLAVFLPAFVLMLGLSYAYGRVKNIPVVRSVLNYLLPAIIGLLLASAAQIGQQSITGAPQAAIFAIAMTLMVWKKTNPVWLIATAGLAGLAMHL